MQKFSSNRTVIKYDNSNNDHLYKNIHLKKSGSALFGFSIKGGQTKPVGIFVTRIDEEGPAVVCDLQVDDEIIEVNEIDFTKLTIQNAINALHDANEAHIVLKRSIHGQNHYIRIKRPNLNESFGFSLGMNAMNNICIKDIDVQLQQAGLQAGDELIEINGKSFENYSLSKARQFLRLLLDLHMKIKRPGKMSNNRMLVDETTSTLDHQIEDEDVQNVQIVENNVSKKDSTVVQTRRDTACSSGSGDNSTSSSENNLDEKAESCTKQISFLNMLGVLNAESIDDLIKLPERRSKSPLRSRIDYRPMPVAHQKQFLTKAFISQLGGAEPARSLRHKRVYTKPSHEIDSAYNFEMTLPCQDECTVLNFETEHIMPESSVHSKVINESDYDYVSDTNSIIAAAAVPKPNMTSQAFTQPYMDTRANTISTYKIKALSNWIQYRPDGLVLIKFKKNLKRYTKFGLRLCYGRPEVDTDYPVRDSIEIKSVEPNSGAESVNLFEPGMIIKKVNNVDFTYLSTISEAECILEKIYEHFEIIYFLIKPKSYLFK